MNTNELTKIFTDKKIPLDEKISGAVEYLGVLAGREEGTEIPDIETLAACVRMITDLEITPDEAALFTAIGKYLKASPVYRSADYLEDYFDLDFETADSSFDVDYTGKYTFVPDHLLPESLACERKYNLILARFYFENVYSNTFLRPNLESLSVPGLELCSVDLKKTRMSESIFIGSGFKECTFDSIAMYKADLRDCSFTGCSLDGVNLNKSLLEGTRWKDCSFARVSLFHGNFDKVIFNNCRFIEVEMCFTDFKATDIGSSVFEKCWISGARISQVKALTQKQLETFFGDESTILPEHLERPAFWPRKGDITTWRHWIETGEVIESKASLTYE